MNPGIDGNSEAAGAALGAGYCAQSMNSEAFSHFSFPSNNFVNGMRVNVPPGYQKGAHFP